MYLQNPPPRLQGSAHEVLGYWRRAKVVGEGVVWRTLCRLDTIRAFLLLTSGKTTVAIPSLQCTNPYLCPAPVRAQGVLCSQPCVALGRRRREGVLEHTR